jgi:hypothetical protein
MFVVEAAELLVAGWDGSTFPPLRIQAEPSKWPTAEEAMPKFEGLLAGEVRLSRSNNHGKGKTYPREVPVRSPGSGGWFDRNLGSLLKVN